MSCIVEFEDFRFNFVENTCNQSLLLNVLITFNLLNLEQISIILNEPIHKLKNVCNRLDLLCAEPAEKLGKLFLMMFYYPN